MRFFRSLKLPYQYMKVVKSGPRRQPGIRTGNRGQVDKPVNKFFPRHNDKGCCLLRFAQMKNVLWAPKRAVCVGGFVLAPEGSRPGDWLGCVLAGRAAQTNRQQRSLSGGTG